MIVISSNINLSTIHDKSIYSSMLSGIISSKAPSPEWVYVDGEYYWDGDDTHVWDYDNGVLWGWDRDTNTWTYIRDIP